MKVTYEQCVWDEEHVKEIYKILNGTIIADGGWHDFPDSQASMGKYRIYDEKYFQAVFAQQFNQLFEKIVSIAAIATDDDAEWEIEQHEGGYSVTSAFTYTPGPFPHQEAVRVWLERHGLDLNYEEFHVRGISYFSELDSACLLDAIERLNWLEITLSKLNQALQETASNFWQATKHESDKTLVNLPPEFDDEEIIPVPLIGKTVPKRRAAIVDPIPSSEVARP